MSRPSSAGGGGLGAGKAGGGKHGGSGSAATAAAVAAAAAAAAAASVGSVAGSVSSTPSSAVCLTSASLPGQTPELTALFECPVCFDYVLPPILQCQAGHLVCNPCRQKLSCCPTCRGPLTPSIRNLAMEKVASTLPFPCKVNTTSGHLLTGEPFERLLSFGHFSRNFLILQHSRWRTNVREGSPKKCHNNPCRYSCFLTCCHLKDHSTVFYEHLS